MAIKTINGLKVSQTAEDIMVSEFGISLAEVIRQRLINIPIPWETIINTLQENVTSLINSDSHINNVEVACETDDTGTTHAEGAYQDGVLVIKLYNVKGDKGDTFTFEDLTDEQKAELKGEKMTFADLTEEEKNELRGAKGEGGKSAYELAVENGFVGTVAEWFASQKGEKGEPGANGKDGKNGADGHVNVVNQVEPNDQTNAVTGKAVANYVGTHSGGDNIVGGNNVFIETLPNGSKRINAQLAGGTAQAASEVSYNNGDGTQTNLQDKISEIDNRVSQDMTLDDEEEVVFSDDGTEDYVKIGHYGIKAKRFFDMYGNPIGSSDNPYSGKRVLFFGDSLVSALRASNGGFVKLIADKYNIPYLKDYWGNIPTTEKRDFIGIKNVAKDGTKLRNNGADAICNRVVNWCDPDYCDLAVIQGGTNDFSDRMGEISSSYAGGYDNTTTIGALETIFKHCTDNGIKTCYIIMHKVGYIADNYYEFAKQVCQKWGIPYLDLTHSAGFYMTYDNVRAGELYSQKTTENWDENVTYGKDDKVAYNGSSYKSIDDGNIGHIPTDGNYWTFVSARLYDFCHLSDLGHRVIVNKIDNFLKSV